MTSPGSDSPDQGANQDDAVWLDLVARLEGDPPKSNAASPGPADAQHGQDRAADTPGQDPAAETPGQDSAEGTPGRSASFRDFDPLGLAGAAPTELSAAERRASAPGSSWPADAGEGSDGPGQPHQNDFASGGPRDYGVAEDHGDFIPEDPPSLAGTDPLTMLAWLGAVGAPVALLLSVMFWRTAPLLAILGMVAVFLLAVVYLIMKLPQEKDENDDGARV